MQKSYRVDSRRIYATGWSDGGYGVFCLLFKYPDRFAVVDAATNGVRDLINNNNPGANASASLVASVNYVLNVDGNNTTTGTVLYTINLQVLVTATINGQQVQQQFPFAAFAGTYTSMSLSGYLSRP